MTTISRTRRIVAAALGAGFLAFCLGAASVAPAPGTAGDSNSVASPTATPTPTATRTPTPLAPGSGVQRGQQFYSGTSIDVTGTVDGDVYAAGQSVTVSGHVTGDVIAAAQVIVISGTVDGNVRLAGQSVTVTGTVSRSGTVFASDVTVTRTGSFGDDIVGAASTFRVAGDIGRNLQLSVGTLTIDGSVGGDVSYSSDTAARISEGAVSGTVDHVVPAKSPTVEVSPWAVLLGWIVGLLYALVALSLITVIAGLLLPALLQRVTDHLVPSPWRALLVGFVAAVTVPFVLLFLLLTVIGAPLALAGFLVWSVMTLATFVYGAFYLGRLILRGRHHPVVTALVGGLILIVALLIPWLNVLVWLSMVFFGLGAQLLELYRQRQPRS